MRDVQSMSSDTDDDDCEEYFLQPVSNQYNISDKIKEANHKLFNSTESIPQRRQSSQRVRFKDNLVEFESEEHDTTTMESSSLRIESVEEEFEEDESIEVENVEEKIEENSSEIDELRGASGSVEIYDENDFEMETQMTSNENGSNGVNGLGDDKTSALKVERPPGRRRSLPPVTRVTPMSESCEELRRLSAKNCCKFKELNEYIEKLPRYNGFNSRYGLSKEDIERRELARLRREQVRNSKHVEQMQQKELVARINEEAYAKWLYKKLRHPMNAANKSNPKNMFDVKPKPSQPSTTRKFIFRQNNR